jgi:hypothetical protein
MGSLTHPVQEAESPIIGKQNMPFLQSIQQRVATYPPGSPERLILDFLLQNGVGRAHAQPWEAIQDHLRQHGFNWRVQTFQQGLLKESREGDMYIGSNDHLPYRGYFIIAEREDAHLMSEWYERRIAKEREHLDRLTQLTNQQWP